MAADQPGRQSSHEAAPGYLGRRRRFGRGGRGHPGRGRMAAPGLAQRQREPVDRRGRDGRPGPGQLGVAGRGVPGGRVRGLQHGRGRSSSSSPCSCRRWSPWAPWRWPRRGPGGPPASARQVGLQHRPGADRGGPGPGGEPRPSRLPRRPSPRARSPPSCSGVGVYFAVNTLPDGRRRDLDGHDLARVHQRSADPGDAGRRGSTGRRGPGPGDPGPPVGAWRWRSRR